MTGKQDVITGSKGPVAIDKDPLDPDVTAGDAITTSEATAAPAAEPTDTSLAGGAGDRDWTDVHNRVLQMAGTNPAQLHGALTYSEEPLDDEGIERLEGQTQKAGATPGLGRSLGKSAAIMGYGVKYKAAKE